MPAQSLADPVVLAFIVLPVLLALAFGAGTAAAWRGAGASSRAARRVGAAALCGAAVWMALTWAAAASGVLLQWERTPPPFAFLVVAIVLAAFGIAFSRVGTRMARHVPLWALVGAQAFRLPLEVAMHAMHERGVMPVQMSYSGYNFDIVSGATAVFVAALLLAGRAGRRLVAAWNTLGLALLLNVVVVAILATPRFRFFGDDHLNVWVMYPPYVWLPAVMVLAALAGHLVIYRAVAWPAAIPAREAP